MKKTTFLFVGNASYLNRGCEAIVRGTAHILRNSFAPVAFVNANFDNNLRVYQPPQTDADLVHKPIRKIKRWSRDWFVLQALKRLHPSAAPFYGFRGMREDLRACDAALSIGGDNYSLDYGIPMGFIHLDRFVLKYSPLVIWGASVGPFDANPAFAQLMHRHLKDEVTAIFVRESRSLEYLDSHGIRDHVHLMADPAFVMEPRQVGAEAIGCDLQEGAIGFNLGPLMARFIPNGSREALVTMSREFLAWLRSSTGRQIVLIPHVSSPRTNDHALLAEIYRAMPDRAGIVLLPDTLDAAQTKGIISRLECLIASRTHATIAGLSSCVPTVSLAYSAKAYGINQDLFGSTDYVVEPDKFSPAELQARTGLVLRNAPAIREHLKSRMAQVRLLAMSAGTTLKNVLAA